MATTMTGSGEIATRIQQVLSQASLIRQMFEEGERLKRERGPEAILDLSLGNPIVEPPAAFKEALREAAADPAPGLHRYMPNPGIPEAREAIARRFTNQTGLDVGPERVVLTVGAAGGINIVLKTILDEGDEVLVPVPYFVEYLYYIENHQGRTILVPTTDRFDLDLEAIERAITPKTRAILVNSPNNPTGVVYPHATLEGLADRLAAASIRHGRPIYLLADEPYRHIVVPGVEVPHIQKIYPHTIVATSHSKDLGLPGERIGQVVLGPGIEDPATFVSALSFSMRALGFVNAPAFMQRVIARLGEATVDTQLYHTNREILVEGLRASGYELVEPGGAFYLFPKTPIPDDIAFCRELARQGLLIVPGTGFGSPGHARIAYCVPTEIVERAVALLSQHANPGHAG